MPQIEPPPSIPVEPPTTLRWSPELSEWRCYLFGSGGPAEPGGSIVFRPSKGNHPNAWWRFWQYVILGNRWVRDIDSTNHNG